MTDNRLNCISFQKISKLFISVTNFGVPSTFVFLYYFFLCALVTLLLLKHFYTQICDALDKTRKICLPLRRINYYKDHIVPGFNEHVKELHDIARHDFVA